MREISDYPYTDTPWSFRRPNPHASLCFDPSGRIDTQHLMGPAGAICAWLPPSDPVARHQRAHLIGVDPADASRARPAHRRDCASTAT